MCRKPTDRRPGAVRRRLADIIGGDDAAGLDRLGGGRLPSRLMAGEDGMVAWATVVAMIFVSFLGALVFNVGKTINQKIETQNAADSVAYSSELWMARGMNAVTAANHMMGELTALYVLHHSIGGKRLDTDDGDSENNSGPALIVNLALELDWNTLMLPTRVPIVCPVNPSESTYETVSEQPYSDMRSTIYDAKVRLKEALIAAYAVHLSGFTEYTEGEAIVPTLFFTEEGLAMMAEGYETMEGAYATEEEIGREYRFLDVVEDTARFLRPVKRAIPGVLDALWQYEDVAIKDQIPLVAALAGQQIGEQDDCTGAISLTTLPVAQDAASDIDRCQLMRAQYPWTRYWRNPIANIFLRLGAPLSGASEYYIDWSDQFSHEVVERFVNQTGEDLAYAPSNKLRLYVVKGLELEGVVKGREAWTNPDQNDLVEDQFCLTGYARQHSPPPIASPKFFRQENPDGVLCFAQAIIYNANFQTPPDEIDTSSKYQPRAGWDTLNWNSDGPDSNAVEFKHATWQFASRGILDWYYGFGGQVIPVDFNELNPFGRVRPQIRLNWQAKLTPVTHHKLTSSIPVNPGIATEMVTRVFYVPFSYYPQPLTTH